MPLPVTYVPKSRLNQNPKARSLNMDTSFNLTEAGEGTNMKWEAEVHLLGPVASMGQRVLQPIVNQQVSQVLGALDKQVQEAKAG